MTKVANVALDLHRNVLQNLMNQSNGKETTENSYAKDLCFHVNWDLTSRWYFLRLQISNMNRNSSLSWQRKLCFSITFLNFPFSCISSSYSELSVCTAESKYVDRNLTKCYINMMNKFLQRTLNYFEWFWNLEKPWPAYLKIDGSWEQLTLFLAFALGWFCDFYAYTLHPQAHKV